MGNCRLIASCCSCLLIFIGGIVCLILFLGVIPYYNIKFHVIDASLTEFYLTNDDVLHYNLAVNISVRNSNKIARVSYRGIRSETDCYGKKLAFDSLPSFRQGTKNTTSFRLVTQGQRLLKLRGSHLKDFNNDQRDGSYSISLALYLKIQLKHAGGGKGDATDFIVNCGLLRIHLLGSSSSFSNNQTGNGGLFKTLSCGVHFESDNVDY